jgi:hypothetical protein
MRKKVTDIRLGNHQPYKNVDENLRSKNKIIHFFFKVFLINSVVHLHHVRQHLDRVVVVQLKVQNHQLFVQIQIMLVIVHHLHLVNRVHHQNDVVVKVVMRNLADIFALFAHAMSKQQNVYMAYLTIATIFCMSTF